MQSQRVSRRWVRVERAGRACRGVGCLGRLTCRSRRKLGAEANPKAVGAGNSTLLLEARQKFSIGPTFHVSWPIMSLLDTSLPVMRKAMHHCVTTPNMQFPSASSCAPTISHSSRRKQNLRHTAPPSNAPGTWSPHTLLRSTIKLALCV